MGTDHPRIHTDTRNHFVIRVNPWVIRVESLFVARQFEALIQPAGDPADHLLHGEAEAGDPHGGLVGAVAVRAGAVDHEGDAGREGGQAQFIAAPVAGEGEGRLAALLDWMRQHCHEPQEVTALAARAGMSPRSFARRFKQATGLAPHDWLLRQRVRRAQDLLETSALPIERIGERCGFGAPETLRHHFRRVLGTTPSAYRKAFGANFLSEQRTPDQHQA